MNDHDILLAKSQWDHFVKGLTDQKKKELVAYQDSINSLDVYTYFINKDFIKFDRVVDTLPKQYLFEDNIIQLIYACYVERNLPEVALNFIDKAIEHHDQEALTSSISFTELRLKLMDQRLFDNLRRSLTSLRTVSPEHIPGILPPILNGQYNFKEFILGEIIAALKILGKKKKAIKTDKENFINDILVAIMQLRLPLWGWEISDQDRSGSSVSGKDAGEVDCTIRAAGNDLAIIEAFTLEGKNTITITNHVQKCFNYNESINAHYIVVYFTGKKENFDQTWNSYKEVVLEVDFPRKYPIDKTCGMLDLESKFKDIQNINVGKTVHKSIELFHVMIDLS